MKSDLSFVNYSRKIRKKEQKQKAKVDQIEDNWRRWKKKEQKEKWWVKILRAQIIARVRMNASLNSRQTNNWLICLNKSWFVDRRSIANYRWDTWWDYLTRFLILDDKILDWIFFSQYEKRKVDVIIWSDIMTNLWVWWCVYCLFFYEDAMLSTLESPFLWQEPSFLDSPGRHPPKTLCA